MFHHQHISRNRKIKVDMLLMYLFANGDETQFFRSLQYSVFRSQRLCHEKSTEIKTRRQYNFFNVRQINKIIVNIIVNISFTEKIR